MKVSLNTIRQYIDFELPPVDELVARINAQLGGVEEVVDLSAKYKGIVVAKVVKCEPHPDSDHLYVCEIDAGDYPLPSSVDRLPSGLIQVVCGAPNVREGLMVAWLPPGATVPASFDTSDPFVLGSRNLRGVMSNGMIASAAELAVGDNHDGILEISIADLPNTKYQTLNTKQNSNSNDQKELWPGQDFAATFGLDDTIIDIENKMFTHRPDLFGQLGVAREIAGIFGHSFKSPDWYVNPVILNKREGSSEGLEGDLSTPPLSSGSAQDDKTMLQLEVFNDTPKKVPRLMFVCMKDIEVKPSPLWLQCALVALGGKPINNIVDATNYVMLLTAQPTHAYDYDKLRGHKIGARMAHEGEQVPLLNGKTYELTTQDIVIADAEGAIGLGGIMGGGNSEVSADTKNIVLEVANFDMYAVRKSSMRHGVFTDALTRFNKGQSPLQNDHVLSILMASIQDMSPAEQASDVFDITASEPLMKNNEIQITSSFISDRLGAIIDGEECAILLGNVEFRSKAQLSPSSHDLTIKPPFWRTDIELPEDIVEEVGRLYGFDKLPRELPSRSMKPTPLNQNIEMKRKIAQILSGAGANEVKTYSFVHERVLKSAGQDPEQAYRLGNALSPELQYYRLSLMPSLLAHVHANIKAGHDEFALYEFGKAHNKKEFDAEGLPKEVNALAYVYAAKKAQPGAAYFRAKRVLQRLLDESGITTLKLEPLEKADLYQNPWLEQMVAPFDPRRSAVLRAADDSLGETQGLVWGVVGEYTPAVKRACKLPEYCAGFELDPLLFLWSMGRPYVPLSRFPRVIQDISLKVSADVPYAELYRAADGALNAIRSNELLLQLTPLGIYQADGGDTKTITLRITATNYERTLTDTEVSSYLERLAIVCHEQCGAVMA